ncbi:MAG TPA: hypothetical protein VL027_01965 [Spongiibacteraceae bacterium]|jgi:hypothetical protein|nr:hypothetical protein [Spongiibacteraceae bacterium]HUH36689.1 hypothetical protein [Spongiibacteraceae bacterium]
MKLVKKTAEHRVYQRRDNRYAVTNAAGQAVNGEEKVKVLVAEGLVTLATPKAPAVEEAPADEAAAE